MATPEQFKIMLAEVEADVVKTEESLRELRAVAKYLRKRINGHVDNNPVLPGINAGEMVSKPYAKVKLPTAMEAVLKERGAPMHMNDIARALVQGGYKNRESLAVSVASTAKRREDLFDKVGPATYSLKNGGG